jgi:transcriptional regulator with XRE-family HTH domain
MDMLEVIRQKTGISQYKLADFLNVSRSTINLAEKGLRRLPREASLRATALFLTITENEKAAKNKHKQTAASDDKTKMLLDLAGEHNFKMQQCRSRARALQRNLDKVKKQNLQLTTKQEMINALKQHFPLIKKNEVDETWLAYQEVIIKRQVSKPNVEEERLQAEIDMQLGYAAVHETILKKYWPDQFAK